MLSYVASSVFDSPAQTLVNTVNTVGVMGKGIAAEFKRRYPEMFQRYKVFCDRGQLQVGLLYLYRTPHKWILNFPTKQHWRNPSKIQYIETGLRKFIETYREQGISSISFPQLGCGNGGLAWDDVRPVMEHYLATADIPVYVHVTPGLEHFVPEHREDAMRERQEIGFAQFFADLLFVESTESTRVPPSDSTSENPPPILTLVDATATAIPIAGEDLEDFWNSLRMRGALPVTDLPGKLSTVAKSFVRALMKLDYIQPIRFVSPTGGDIPGVRFAPSSSALVPNATASAESAG